MLIDNNWAHLEEAPVEKIWCFYSCSFYPKINSSFIVTYMYWNSFIFQVHLGCFTCATPCGFTMNFYFWCVEFPSKSPGDSRHCSEEGCLTAYRQRERWNHQSAKYPSPWKSNWMEASSQVFIFFLPQAICLF